MVGVLVATVFGTLSVSAVVIKKQNINPFSPSGFEETGGIGAFVFYTDIVETDDTERRISITDATVICTDINGNIHEMLYEEIEPGFYLYVAYNITEGKCKITASKQGFISKTIDAFVYLEGLSKYDIELEENPISRSAFERLIPFFNDSFIIRVFSFLSLLF